MITTKMAESTFLYCVLLIGMVGILYAECPPGWLQHGYSCYYFSDNRLSWEIAQDVCKSFNGYLAEVETQSESDFLETISKANGLSYWLGGKDDVTEGHWYWAYSHHPFEYADWAPGEPNNRDNDEDCLHLFDVHAYHWNDLPCANEQHFICETRFSG